MHAKRHFEAVIGLEAHVELETRSKMFCACPRVDSTQAAPNTSVCPVCAGMPGVLPVVNQRAVEYALRVALALGCEINPLSIFARKNYFYPDLPKGFQISQYEQPLARNGSLTFPTLSGDFSVRIRRVHLEEDTGKLTHFSQEDPPYSLLDLNRAGIPLLEIVTEPDMHSPAQVRFYAMALRTLLRYLEVNSGDLEKGVFRLEPNISVRPAGSQQFGVRTEIKNLNSFRALERAVSAEIERQITLLASGKKVFQETRGWDESKGETVLQRRKEAEDDYRYFPEPDLPPLVIEPSLLERIHHELPELPEAKRHRFQEQYGLGTSVASLLVSERAVADYFEKLLLASPATQPKVAAFWITGELFGLLNQAGFTIGQSKVTPESMAELLNIIERGEINQNTAKFVLGEMFKSGKTAREIIIANNLSQVSDTATIAGLVDKVLAENPAQLRSYLAGKEGVARWLFGQVMRLAGGQANPQVVKKELDARLEQIRKDG